MASPMSTQQRSAEECREQFDRRMKDMVSVMESEEAFFFSKRVTKSMGIQVVQGPYAYSLEFPKKFLDLHSKKFDKDVTFQMEDSEQTWPIKLTVRAFKNAKGRVFAYGAGGWKAFLMDNHIKVGDFLIFELIRFSHFEVVIYRAPVEVDAGDDDDDKSSDQAPESDSRVCNQAPPCLRFVVTIRPPSFHSRQLSLAVPGQFWELHGSRLECDELELEGPYKVICKVKAKRTYHDEGDEEEPKLRVLLESGWESFLVVNKLEVGDVLEFVLVGSSCFTVDLVERIEKD